MIVENFLITEQDIETAQNICQYVSDENIRNRSIANVLASKICHKFFADADVDSATSICQVAAIQSKIDVSDVYVNGAHIDVRFYFDENEIYLPKSHKSLNIEPVVYMFIKLNEDFSGGTVTGFLQPESIDVNNFVNDYYKINEDSLVSYYDIEMILLNHSFVAYPDDFTKQAFDFIDGNHDNEREFYQLLFSSSEARENLINIAKTHQAFSYISINENATTLSDKEISQEISLDDNTDKSALEMNSDEISLDSFNLLESDSEIGLIAEHDSEQEILLAVEPEENALSEQMLSEENLEIQENSFVNDSIDELSEIDTQNTYENVITDSIEEVEVLLSSEDQEMEIVNEQNIPEQSVSEISEEDSSLAELLESEKFEVVNTEESIIEEESDTENVEIIENLISEEENIETEVQQNSQPEDQKEANNALDSLYNTNYEESDSENLEYKDYSTENELLEVKQRKSSFLPALALLAIIGGAGYFGYTKFVAPAPQPLPKVKVAKAETVKSKPVVPVEETKKEEAMPIETVEEVQNEVTEEPISVVIPTIEKNLDASILVSNLSVNWQMPKSYVKNVSVKKYFVRLGKVIQLNLKTELLLSNKFPISNKVSLELVYDDQTSKYNVLKIIDSSGETTIDNMIMQTVKNVLSSSSKVPTFEDSKLNPILVIQF